MKHRIAINRIALDGKIPPGDKRWATFNDSFDNLTLEPVEIANAIYQGYSFTTWHTGRRSLANFALGQHVAIDLDSGDERSRLTTLAAHPWARMYAAFAYTTPSHTDEHPRARVMFLLDEPVTSADGYGEMVQFVMSQFDEPDTSCKDASRFFYGSKDCSIEWFGNTLPVSHLRRLYIKAQKCHPRRRHSRDDTGKVINLDAERTKRRVAKLTDDAQGELDRAADALRKINPYSVDYNQWIGIIAAMRDEFGDAALPVVESWAQGKPGEVEREWKRIKGSGGKRTGMGTVFYLASGQR